MADQNKDNLQDIQRIEKLEKEMRKSMETVSAEEEVINSDFDDYEETHIEPELRKNIEAVLNVMVRPRLAEDGGDLEVVYLDDDGTLWIQMMGGCSGCPSADETAKGLVEKELASRIPQIKSVEIDTGLSDDMIEKALSLLTHRTSKE